MIDSKHDAILLHTHVLATKYIKMINYFTILNNHYKKALHKFS